MTNPNPYDLALAAIPGHADARRALVELDQARVLPGAIPDAKAVHAQLVEEIIAALAAGKPLPADLGQRAYETKLAAEHATAAGEVLAAVRRTLTATLERTLFNGRDAALRALKPLLADVVDQARTLAPTVQPITDPERAINADPAALDAYRKFTALVEEYAAIRDAQRRLTGKPDDCINGMTPVSVMLDAGGELSNLGDVWADWSPTGEAPWPDTTQNRPMRPRYTRDYLLWLALHPVAVPWLPTRVELAENYHEQHAARRTRTDGDHSPVGRAPHARSVEYMDSDRVQLDDGRVVDMSNAH